MADNFWGTDEEMSEEEAEQALINIEPDYPSPTEEQEDAEYEEAYDSQVLKDASLRLEQGNLYKMLLKHDLFDGVDADPRAISNVQRELRAFIRERLEVLVGLRTDPKLLPKVSSNQFTDLEMQVLKEFLSKATGRATSAPAQQKPSPVQASSPQKNLKPVVSQNRVSVNPVKQKTQVRSKPEPVSNEGPGLEKAPSQMTVTELMEYNKTIKARQASRKAAQPIKKIPMPDGAQLETMYATRLNVDPGQGLVGMIMAKMNKPLGVSEIVSGGSDEGSNDDRM